MAKKCIYCKSSIEDNSVVDVCHNCGIGVWGRQRKLRLEPEGAKLQLYL